MIYLYTGTPGSGKSLHVIKDMVNKIKGGGNVISNFPINVNSIKCKKGVKMGDFVYKPDKDITVDFLMEYAKDNHVKGKEAQTLIVIDEAQGLFNSRDFRDKSRKSFNYFFTIHRHLGYNVILITQSDRLLDRQIRCLVEYEVKHRKLNNFKLFRYIPIKTFICITYWYGVNTVLEKEAFVFNKKIASLYDSYALFNVLS